MPIFNGNIVKVFLFIFALLISHICSAMEQHTDETTIIKISSFAQFNGDVVVRVSSPAVNCTDGFWIRPDSSNPGFQSTLAILLSALHANSNVQIYGLDTERWPGSPSGAYCKISTINLDK